MERWFSDLLTDRETPFPQEILTAQARDCVDRYKPGSRDDDENLIPCLRAFLDWLPEAGRESVARGILNCKDDDEKLHGVFTRLCTSLLIPMKTVYRKSSVEGSPSPESQGSVNAVTASLSKPKNGEAELGQICLRRDGNRCVISGQMDVDYWVKIGEPDGQQFADLEAAHIIPFSYASWKNNQGMKNASGAWETLYRCFPAVRHAGMCIQNINDAFNGMMLSDYMHVQFGKFRLAFAPTSTPHQYQIKVYRFFPSFAEVLLPANGVLTMQRAQDAQDVDLPSPALLECHYRIAEILNASGMGEVIDRKMNEWDRLY